MIIKFQNDNLVFSSYLRWLTFNVSGESCGLAV